MGLQQAVHAPRTTHTRVADTHRNALVRSRAAVQLHGGPVHPAGADVRRGAQVVPDNQREDRGEQGIRIRRVFEQRVRNHSQMRFGRQGDRRLDTGLRLVGRQSHHVRFTAFQVLVRRQLAEIIQRHERVPESVCQSCKPAVLSG